MVSYSDRSDGRTNEIPEEVNGIITMKDKILLASLEIGDRFYYPGNKNKRYKVVGKVEFNIRRGTATRKCYLEGTKSVILDKLPQKLVIKLPVKNI